MYSSISLLAEGIGAQVNTTSDNQSTAALFAIRLAMSFLTLTEAWMKQVGEDNALYVQDAIKVAAGVSTIDPKTGKPTGIPMSPAVPAADNMKKVMDSNESDLETGKLNTLIETVKAKAQYDGNSMAGVFNLEAPIIDFMNGLSTLINSILK